MTGNIMPSPEGLRLVQAVLLHTLWQGGVVAGVVYILLRGVRGGLTNVRYTLALGGLLGVVIAALATWCVVKEQPGVPEMGATAVQAGSVGFEAVDGGGGDSNRVAAKGAADSGPRGGDFAWLVWAWMGGVSLMLARVAWLMQGAGNLRRRCRPLEDARVLALVEEVRAAFSITRRVGVLAVDELASPVAMGLVWPVVLMPSALATGLPVEVLRAVLAHELAHIRRYDYLVNFVQLVIEALLYFNPAVWWLSRQVRIEREACCDAAAARAQGEAVDYAAALAEVARLGRVTGRAMAGQGLDGGRSSLVERVRRLLLPGYRPALRVRWYGMAAGMLVTAAILLGLYEGSAATVAMAEWLLSDEERVGVMTQLQEDLHLQQWPEGGARAMVGVSGSVITPEGEPLPDGKSHMHVTSVMGGSTYTSSPIRLGGHFEGKVEEGDIYVCAEIPGYAPARVGPLRADGKSAIEDIEVHLDPSEPVMIRFVDKSGEPVPGVTMNGGYKFVERMWRRSLRLTANEEGIVRLDQADPPFALSLRAMAEGFQQSEQPDLVVRGGEAFDWVLVRDEPIEGMVVDSDTGRGISGAKIGLVYESGRGFGNDAGGKGWAESEDTGRFVLRGLNEDRIYFFMVSAAGYGSEVIRCPGGASTPLRVALGPRYVRGVIRGDLSLLAQGAAGPVISSSMPLDLPGLNHRIGEGAKETPVKIVNGEGHFEVHDLRAGDLHIAAGPKQVRVKVNEPVEDLVISLDEEVEKTPRTVRFQFAMPEGAPAASGSVSVWTAEKGSVAFGMCAPVEVVEGCGETQVDTPARLKLKVDGLTGYLATSLAENGRERIWEVPAGSDPYVIEVALARAGAIHGQVVRPDGQPAAGAHVFVMALAESDEAIGWELGRIARTNVTCNEQGEFALMPLPLEHTYEVVASAGFARCTKQVRVEAWNPVVNAEWPLPEGKDTAVQVVKSDGKPLPDTEVTVAYPGGVHSGMRTDGAGKVTLLGLDPALEYWLRVEPAYGFQHSCVLIDPGEENVVRVEEGLSAGGVLLTQGDERPVSNEVVMAAALTRQGSAACSEYLVQAVTDEAGRFQFTDLCPGQFMVVPALDSGIAVDMAPEARTFEAGQEAPIVVWVHPKE